MKSGLFFIPFLALLVGSIGTAIGSAFGEISWINYVAWGVAAALIGLWVSLDFEGFRRLFFRKGAKYGASSGLTILLGVLVITGLAFLSNKPRFNKSYDATKSKLNTLSDQSVRIIQGMKDKNQTIDVTAFFQDEEQKQKFKDLLENYQRVGEVLKVTYLSPQINPTEAKALNITSANTVIFKSDTQEARITQFTEEKITNALVKVLKDRAKKIYFTKGHGEPQVRDEAAESFSIVVTELENNRYEVAEISILETGKIADDTDLLVIAGPRYDFQPQETAAIEQYLKQGGALLIAVDAMVPVPNLSALTKKVGITYNDDFLILRPDDPRARLVGQNNAIISKFDETNPVTKDFAAQRNTALLVPNSRSLTLINPNELGMKATLIGETAEIIIRVKDVRTQNDLKDINQSRIEAGQFGVFAASSGKITGPDLAKNENATADSKKADGGSEAGGSSSSKEIRVVAAGSSQFATNVGAQRPENRDFFMNSVNYLLQDEDFISIRPREAEKGNIDVTSAQSQLALAFFSFIYPFVFLGGGIVYWLRRRKA